MGGDDAGAKSALHHEFEMPFEWNGRKDRFTDTPNARKGAGTPGLDRQSSDRRPGAARC